MRILITGGAGFLGARLAREILKRGQLNGQTVDELVLADLFPAPADLQADARVKSHAGPMLEQADLLKSGFDGVFHLASAVSGECELDFDLGMRSNVDSTRLLLDSLRASGKVSRLVFASSVAVFGPDAANPMPDRVSDNTLPSPQTSYGTHKLMLEYLVADYTRKGFIDGRVARLMTVSVRPGKPNGAASSFLSGIVREPLAGVATVCPVELSTAVALSSPETTIAGILAVAEATREAFGGRTALNLPALTVTVGQMLEALERVAGKDVASLVTVKPDPTITKIVGGWPSKFDCERTHRFGLQPDMSYQAVIEQYIRMQRG